MPLEAALHNWLAELRLSNRSQTTIDWYRDLFVGRILPSLTGQGIRTVDQLEREHVRALREQLQAGTGGRTLLPEFYLQKGDFLLSLPGADGREASSYFLRSFEIAVELGARMTQLRAATGLCRSQREPADAEQARQRLRATYATFTEGFATADLIDAKDFLERVPREIAGSYRNLIGI